MLNGNWKVWTKYYDLEKYSFPLEGLAYDFLVGYIGSVEEVEEMLEEGFATIFEEVNDDSTY